MDSASVWTTHRSSIKKHKRDEDGDAPSKKRDRTKKACDFCVRMKLKCDGIEPCSRCSKRSQNCTYLKVHKIPARYKRRNCEDGELGVGQPHRQQQITTSNTGPSNVMDSLWDYLGTQPKPSGYPKGPNRQQGFQKPFDQMDSSDSSSDAMLIHEEWGNDKEISLEITNAPLTREHPNAALISNPLTTGGGPLPDVMQCDSTPSSNHTSIVNPHDPSISNRGIMSISEILTPSGDEQRGANTAVTQVPWLGVPNSCGIQMATQIGAIQHRIPDAIPLFADLPPLPPQEIQNLLIRLYFKNVWPWLPCVDKTRFLRDRATYPPILTYSMYACAARFCEDSSIDYRPHRNSTPNLLLVRCARLLPTVFDMRRPSVHHVQAILNMCVQSNTHPEFEQGRVWVGMAMVLARIIGLSSEGGGDKSGTELWNRGISTIAQGEDMAERKMDEMRRTWYCCLAWDRFAGIMEPRTWTTALDEGRDVRVPPPLPVDLGPAQLAAALPELDELMSLYSNFAHVVEFRQYCIRTGVDPCDVDTSSGKKLYLKLRHLDGILVEWYRSLPDSTRTLKMEYVVQGRERFLKSAYILIMFYAMRVILNGPATVMPAEELVASSPVTLRNWMSTPCFLISTSSAGNLSTVLECVLDVEGERGLDFGSPLLWGSIWKSAMVRAVSVKAMRAYTGVAVSSRTPDPSCPVVAPGVDPATVAARETRELSIFRRAVHTFRKWWVTKSEVQPKQSLFKRIFCEIGFPMEGMPVLTSVVQSEGQERVAKMGAVVIVREQEVNDVSCYGSLGGMLQPYPVFPLRSPDHVVWGTKSTSLYSDSTPGFSGLDHLLDFPRTVDDVDQDLEQTTVTAEVNAPTQPSPLPDVTELDLSFLFGGPARAPNNHRDKA